MLSDKMASQLNLRRVAAGAFLFITTISVFLTLASHTLTGAVDQRRHELRNTDLLSHLLSPRTAQAVASDEVLQRNFLDAVEVTADLAKRLAAQFDTVTELQQTSEKIESYRRSLAGSIRTTSNGLTRRKLGDLLGDLTGAAGGAAGSTKAGAGGLLSGITGGIGSALSGIGSTLLKDASGAGFFLGTGLGAGAAQGLNLAPAAMTKQVAAKVAQENGMNASGLNPAIQSAALGLTASLLGAVNVSSLAGSAGAGSIDINSVAAGLATGIGNGASAGLNLSPQASALQAPAGNTTGDIAGTFGFALTKSLLSNVNVSSLASSATSGASSFNISMITGGQPASAIALSLAQGIGNGASSGLKLSQANLAPPEGTSAADVAGAFAFGLTQSVTQNINTSNINLGGSSSALSGLTKNVDMGRVAQGAAMGLIQGAGDAVNAMGGVQALINGTAVVPTGSLPDTVMTFNDSVGGAATGFGQGLGGQGTLVGVQLFSKFKITDLIAGGSGNTSAAVKRHLLHPAEIIRRQTEADVPGANTGFNLSAIFNAAAISSVGQSALDALGCEGIGGLVLVVMGLMQSNTLSTGSVSSFNTTLIKSAIPKGVIHLTSGGNTFDIDGTIVSDNLDGNLLAAANGVLVNGNPAVKFAAFLVIHILFALLAFIVILPLVLGMEAVRNLLVRLKMSHVLSKIPKGMDIIWLYLMTPLAIISLVFGILAGGTAGHFRTSHGILGLLTIVATLAASAAHFYARNIAPEALKQGLPLPTPFRLLHPITIRGAILQLLSFLTLPAIVAGFADLGSVSLCVTRVIPLEAALPFAVGLFSLYTGASALMGLTGWLTVRELLAERKKAKRAGKQGFEAGVSRPEESDGVEALNVGGEKGGAFYVQDSRVDFGRT